jgi:hypothetical protein
MVVIQERIEVAVERPFDRRAPMLVHDLEHLALLWRELDLRARRAHRLIVDADGVRCAPWAAGFHRGPWMADSMG